MCFAENMHAEQIAHRFEQVHWLARQFWHVGAPRLAAVSGSVVARLHSRLAALRLLSRMWSTAVRSDARLTPGAGMRAAAAVGDVERLFDNAGTRRALQGMLLQCRHTSTSTPMGLTRT